MTYLTKTYQRHFQSALALSTLALAIPWQAGQAATRIVDTTADNGAAIACTAVANDCSLRGAITAAVAGDTITVPALGTYTLAGTEIPISVSLTINGAGATSTIIDGNNASRIFNIGNVPVTINNVTIQRGNSGGGAGGGIYYGGNNTTPLTLNNIKVLNNTAGIEGGGISAPSAPVIVTNSIFDGNVSNGGGGCGGIQSFSANVTGTTFNNNRANNGTNYGGLYGGVVTLDQTTFTNNYAANGGGVGSNSTTTISNSIFTGNQATAQAGALFISSGATATINTSTFTGNQATAHAGALLISSGATATINTSTFVNNCASCGGGGGDGGAILNVGTLTLNDSTFTNNHTTVSTNGENGGALTAGGASTTTINRSTFSGNTATHGGAIFVSNSGSFSLSNSTLTGNSAGNASTAGVSTGGAISLYSGVTTATLKNVTVAGNSVNGSKGGGLYSNGTTTLNLYNSLFANNTGGVNSDCYLFSGSLAVDTNNLVMSGNCGTPAVTTNPSLATLANNGGSTQTMALSLGSSALEVGDDASCLSPSQNGLTRPQGTHCDIGAYEMIGYTFSTAIAGTGTGNVTGSTLAGNYSSGTPMTLVAAATGGSTFIGWTPTSCTNGFALTANTVCTATFDKTNQVISFTPPTSATVGDAPLTLNATGGGSGNPVTFTSTTTSVCTTGGTNGATLTIVGAGTCAVTADQAGNADYNAATPVSQNLTINPMPVPVTVIPSLPPVPVPLPTYQLQITVKGTGQGQLVSHQPTGYDCASTSSPCASQLTGATWLYFTATPNDGSEFTGWSGDSQCVNDGNKIFVGQNTKCTATFSLKSYTLTVEKNAPGATVTGEGINCPDTCQATYPYGTTVKLEAGKVPLEWEWVGWGGSCDSQGQVTITADKTCRAQYREDSNIPANGDGNGDGQLDAHQANVTSLPDKVTGRYVTFAVQPDTCVISDVYTDLPDNYGKPVKNKPMPQGLIYFELACPQAQISLYYHAVSTVKRNFIFRKFGPLVPGNEQTAGWYLLPNVTFEAVMIGGKSVVKASYTLTDGELGDSTGVDGRIVDPGGIVVE